ncbi:MAG TPA: peptide transporter [Deltaproteobacteria bacterium]|nr:peptide transporter [Deltaproteobacteria bacterium]
MVEAGPVPSGTGYREISARAIALGIIQGIAMTAAFTYAGLKLGFGVGGSSVAAILGLVILRGMLRDGTIVENNINQTVASGINTASSGVVFTVPALLLLGLDFNPWMLVIAAVAGSFMGIVVIIPLRKQMVELDRLRFPTGTAVATLLKATASGREKAILLGVGTLLSAAVVVGMELGVVPEEWDVGSLLGLPPYLGVALYLSLMNLGAGLLSGKGGMPFFLGGVLAWWFLAPVAVNLAWIPAETVAAGGTVDFLYGSMFRPLGIGILIGGALMGVVLAFPAIKAAIQSLASAVKLQQADGSSGPADELSARVLYVGVALSAVVLTGVVFALDPSLGLPRILIAGIAGTVWIAVAGLIVAQATGMTDISPLSGLALIAVTLLLGITGAIGTGKGLDDAAVSGAVVVAVAVGVAVCVATSQCADMMQDLKTGHLVGARPAAQQVVQFGVAWIGPLVAIGTMMLLWNTPDGSPGFGPQSAACLQGAGDCLSAPQAGALEGMIRGVVDGNAPVDKYLAGGILGGAVTLFPVGGLGVLLGLAMYLPFSITLGYGIGCMMSMGLQRAKGARWMEDKVVPLAAGLIVGEALTALVFSIAKAFG